MYSFFSELNNNILISTFKNFTHEAHYLHLLRLFGGKQISTYQITLVDNTNFIILTVFNSNCNDYICDAQKNLKAFLISIYFNNFTFGLYK